MRMDSSGDRKHLSPFTGDRNSTPPPVILRNSPRLNTWKPPESVRIGPSQPMNLMQSAMRRDHFQPWTQPQMEGVAEHDVRADVFQLLRRHRLHRAISADRHEGRRLDLAVCQLHCAATGSA